MSEPTLSLTIVSGRFKGERFDVSASGALLGRLDECTIPIRDGTVSSHHLRITLSGTQWLIEDLNSTNHTLLNGERVMPGRITPLPTRGRLTVGDVGMAFEVLRPSAAERPEPRRVEQGSVWAQELDKVSGENTRLRSENEQLRAKVVELQASLEQARRAAQNAAVAPLPSPAAPSPPVSASAAGHHSAQLAQSLQLMTAFGEALDQLSATVKRLKKAHPESNEVDEARARVRDCIMKMADLSSLLKG